MYAGSTTRRPTSRLVPAPRRPSVRVTAGCHSMRAAPPGGPPRPPRGRPEAATGRGGGGPAPRSARGGGEGAQGGGGGAGPYVAGDGEPGRRPRGESRPRRPPMEGEQREEDDRRG